MEQPKKEGRYSRIYNQLEGLLTKTDNTEARMATVIAVLHQNGLLFLDGFLLPLS